MGASDSTPTYVEERSGGFYLRGTRVSLDTVVHQFQQGASAESILRAFPLIGSLERVYGAIAYYLAHTIDVDAYLERQREISEAERSSQRFPDDLRRRLDRARQESHRRP
jgi:uncharacterized protein (DUF433 family)